MNEILSSIQTEEDRQLAILSQVDTLLSSNEEMLLHCRSLHEQQREEEGLVSLTTKDIGIQVDEKDSFGLVDDHGDANAEDVPEFPPGPLTIPPLLIANSKTVPFELRCLMSSFPHVLRIPSLEWTKQSIFSIYLSKIRNDAKFSKQILLEGKKTLAAYLHEYYTALYGLPLIADQQIMVLLRACLLYAPTSKRVWLFSEQLGLADTEKPPQFGIRDTDLILSVIASLQEQGEFQPIQPSSTLAKSRASNDRSGDYTPAPVALGGGEGSAGETPAGVTSPYIKRASALLSAQTIFEKWLPDGANEYLLKIRAMPNTKGSFHVDFDDFLEISMEQWLLVKGIWVEHLACLYHYNSSIFRVISEAQFATEAGNPDRDTVLAQIIRDPSTSLGTRPARLFVEAANLAAAAAAKKVSLYEKLQREFQIFKEEGINLTASEPSSTSAATAAAAATSHRAGKPHQSSAVGSDGEDPSRDSKAGRDSEKEEKGKKDGVGAGGGGGGDAVAAAAQLAGGMKESVVDFMSKKSFVSALRNLKPDLGSNEVNAYFKAAQELGYQTTKRQLESMWVTFPHPTETRRVVYFNRVTGHCQWTCPYRLKTFEAHDIDQATFIEIMIRHQIIDKSPLLEYFHVTPSDLWPNTEVFYRELEISKRRENVKRKQALTGGKRKGPGTMVLPQNSSGRDLLGQQQQGTAQH